MCCPNVFRVINFLTIIYALYQPQGGFLIPERCIESHVRIAQQHGADLLTDTQVLDWKPTEHGVSVRTEGQTFTADKFGDYGRAMGK